MRLACTGPRSGSFCRIARDDQIIEEGERERGRGGHKRPAGNMEGETRLARHTEKADTDTGTTT